MDINNIIPQYILKYIKDDISFLLNNGWKPDLYKENDKYYILSNDYYKQISKRDIINCYTKSEHKTKYKFKIQVKYETMEVL